MFRPVKRRRKGEAVPMASIIGTSDKAREIFSKARYCGGGSGHLTLSSVLGIAMYHRPDQDHEDEVPPW
jgi:hypothetical protein